MKNKLELIYDQDFDFDIDFLEELEFGEYVNDNQIILDVPEYIKPIFDKEIRYICLYGGRGGGKTENVARGLVALAYSHYDVTIMCSRYTLKSIKDSSYANIWKAIVGYGFQSHFVKTTTEIRCKHTNSKFIFAGLKANVENIKSTNAIDILWIEEADKVTPGIWDILKPSVRSDNSKIILTFNPHKRKDIIYQDFVENEPPDYSYIKFLSYRDNEYFPEVLNRERLNDFKRDKEKYEHIWEGKLKILSKAQVFYRNPQLYFVEEFEEDPKVTLLYGLDFGFTDPTAGVECYIKNNCLYITRDFSITGLEVDGIARVLYEKMPQSRHAKIVCDSAYPAYISMLKRQGLRAYKADKPAGSVESGIAHIRSFEKVIIHPRCIATKNEFDLYVRKEDIETGEISDPIDKNNHNIDALRYALEATMLGRMANYNVLGKW